MDALALHSDILTGYRDYIRSFIDIADDDLRTKVTAELDEGKLWPSPLIQFNPAFERNSDIASLVKEGLLRPELEKVFHGYTLYTHQVQAIRLGAQPKSFIVTSGTGSGKSVTYLGSVFNHLFGEGHGSGIRAILVYPMNALINSQVEELGKFARNYREQTGTDFPIRYAAYTGQTKRDERVPILESPPDILLTNYMMLELLLTRVPQRISFDEKGNYEFNEESSLPLRGWFMSCAPQGLLFDPTAGLFFDGNTNERTKLTTLGNEGRSTSTTITSFLVLQGLAKHHFHVRDQKLLSFTDNRQDAALQSGHFNDFVRVVRIRAAIAKAVAEVGSLSFKDLGPRVRQALSLPLRSYARTDDPDPFPKVRQKFEATLTAPLSAGASCIVRPVRPCPRPRRKLKTASTLRRAKNIAT